jgi:hypothetical protein
MDAEDMPEDIFGPADDDLDPDREYLDPERPFRYADLAFGWSFYDKPPNEQAAYHRAKIIEHVRGAVAYARRRVERIEAQLTERERQRVRKSLQIIEGGKDS